MRLQLLVIKLGFLARFRCDDALAVIVHFEHVFGRFLFVERQDLHEHEDDISHLVHRIVPHNYVPALFKSFLNFLARYFDRRGERFCVHAVDRKSALMRSAQRWTRERNHATHPP